VTVAGRGAVLLDRDGTLNEVPANYVTSLDLFHALPGAFEAVGRLTHAGWPGFVATTQACIDKGMVEASVVDEIHDECRRLAAPHGGAFGGFYVCPHVPGAGCSCRKPLPGLLLRAAVEHRFDIFRSFMIGDTARDLVAGRAAGTTSLFVRTGNDREPPEGFPAELAFDDLAHAVDWILASD
jgi:histidinol-phosphate phosphatase family protein